jgi:hypothetical protein
VSYAWEFTDRAAREFRALDTWLQEETLDEIEESAADPGSDEYPRRTNEQVYDFVRDRGGKRVYVFYVASADALTRIFKIVSVGSFSKELPNSLLS